MRPSELLGSLDELTTARIGVWIDENNLPIHVFVNAVKRGKESFRFCRCVVLNRYRMKGHQPC